MGKTSVTEVTKKKILSFILLFHKFNTCNSLILQDILSLILREAEGISFQRKTNTTCV